MSRAPQPLTPAQAGRAQQAQHLLQSGRSADALALARALAVEAPQAPDAHQLLAMCCAEAGQPGEAEQAFRRALACAPGHPMVLGNFATLLRKLGRHAEAVQLLRDATAAAPGSAPIWRSLGLTALQAGQPGQACEALRHALALQPADATAWHALGNACRELDDLEAAEQAFGKAVSLAPENSPAWLNLGAVLRLLGRPDEALACYERAAKLGYAGPDLAFAISGALVDVGRIGDALSQARHLTRSHPAFAPGHVSLAHILWEYGAAVAPGDDPLDVFRAAVDRQPENRDLQLAFAGFLLEARRPEEALARLRDMRAHRDHPLLVALQANAFENLGRSDQAAPLYEQACRALGGSDPSFLNAYAHHLLKARKPEAAARCATEATRLRPHDQTALAYLSTAWRLLDDPREHWLCEYERAIDLVAVEPPAGFADVPAFLAALQATLEPMHLAKREPVHQSLRGGSQTPGRLFGRPDPIIDATRQALLRAIEHHIAGLPDDDAHPFFQRKARSVRFSGSWSVKLWSSGSHVNHIHPEGWMSSAFYVSLPPSVREGQEESLAGCIQFGQPPVELDLDLPPRRVIRPRAGHLALFPSYLWHGTVPFQDDEPRITIAFDMVPRAG